MNKQAQSLKNCLTKWAGGCTIRLSISGVTPLCLCSPCRVPPFYPTHTTTRSATALLVAVSGEILLGGWTKERGYGKFLPETDGIYRYGKLPPEADRAYRYRKISAKSGQICGQPRTKRNSAGAYAPALLLFRLSASRACICRRCSCRGKQTRPSSRCRTRTRRWRGAAEWHRPLR